MTVYWVPGELDEFVELCEALEKSKLIVVDGAKEYPISPDVEEISPQLVDHVTERKGEEIPAAKETSPTLRVKMASLSHCKQPMFLRLAKVVAKLCKKSKNTSQYTQQRVIYSKLHPHPRPTA